MKIIDATQDRPMELTDEQRQAMARLIADYQGDDPENFMDPEVTPFTVTRDPMDALDGRHWAEARGRDDEPDEYGWPARHFDAVQVAKGSPRVELFAMDFGDFRAIWTV